MLATWNKLEAVHGPKYGTDKHLLRDSLVILLVIMSSCLVDNTLYHVHSLHDIKHSGDNTTTEDGHWWTTIMPPPSTTNRNKLFTHTKMMINLILKALIWRARVL